MHELAGDHSYSLAEFAADISRQSGREIPYVDLPEAEFRGALIGAGLPEGLAALLADSDAAAARGALQDDSGALSRLIGRPRQPSSAAVMTPATSIESIPMRDIDAKTSSGPPTHSATAAQKNAFSGRAI